MKNDNSKRQVPVESKKTGERWVADAAPARLFTGAHVAAEQKEGKGPAERSAHAESDRSDNLKASRPELQPDLLPEAKTRLTQEDASHPTVTETPKAKAEVETLEQFVEYAYARKGKPISLKQKVQSTLAKSPHLDEASTSHLLLLAKTDEFLAVPRQLLLASREVEGYPALRSALVSFVKEVMLRHPVFASEPIKRALHNLPDAPSMSRAIALVAEFEQKNQDGKDSFKPSELQALRRNATYLLATWFTCSRGVGLDELVTLLLGSVWSRAAGELDDEQLKLRAITEVEEQAVLGFICQRFQQSASEAFIAQKRAEEEADKLREQVTQLKAQLEASDLALDARAHELDVLRQESSVELAQQGRQYENQRMHLQNDLEQLRGRLVRSLGDNIDMLEVGLTALRNKTPRLEVMLERAEYVVDALRVEQNNLMED